MGREKHKLLLYIICIDLIQFMKAVSKEKTDNKMDIFQRAQLIKKQSQAEEAAKIMNAYRRIQDVKVKDAIKKPQKITSFKKPQSQYANKVKQTLKEMNVNRHKQQKEIKSKNIEFKQERNQAERHLMSSGCKKIFKIMMKKLQKNYGQVVARLKDIANEQSDEIQQLIRVWRLKRIFCAWNYEAMLSKIEAARIATEKAEKMKKSLRLADDFRYFSLVKKTIKFWSSYTKRMIKKRLAEDEQRKIQIAQILEEKKSPVASPKRSNMEKNHQLQNKLRGFLDNLKHQIDGKQRRLNTIKQNTENSEQIDHRNALESEPEQSQPFNNGEQHEQHQNAESDNQEYSQQQPSRNEDSPNRQNRNNGPLTNEQLQKRRKQIAEKAKSRKQALEKLKKEKEQQRKKQEQERLMLEKQIEEEQKKTRQQQYRKFLKKKKQMEQWEERQKQLNYMATQFNRIRIVKYYGWVHWRKIKQVNKQNCQQLVSTLQNMVMRRKLKILVENITQIGKDKLLALQDKMKVIYTRKLLKKCIIAFKNEKTEQLQLKQQLSIRHEVHTLKIFFRGWQRGRAQLQLQNFQWERPRIKRAQCLRAMNLMEKAMKSLKINQQEEIHTRNIKQHKERIRQKIQNIVEQQPTIDYDQFL